MWKHLIDTSIVITVGLALYWVGPMVVNWLMTNVFVTHYQRTLHRKDLEKRQRTLTAMFTNVWRILVVAISLYFASVAIVGEEKAPTLFAPLFASAGIIGVAIGFGAQSIVKDFLSGIFIITENQYRVGDIIEIDGASGTVEQIGVRSTVLRDVDGNVHYVPNGMVQHVINKTMGYSVSRFMVSVSPDTDIETAAKLINRIGLKLMKEDAWKDKILEAPHYVMMGEFSSTAVNLIVSGKTQPSDQWAVTAEMRQRILESFERENIVIGTVPIAHVTSPQKAKKK